MNCILGKQANHVYSLFVYQIELMSIVLLYRGHTISSCVSAFYYLLFVSVNVWKYAIVHQGTVHVPYLLVHSEHLHPGSIIRWQNKDHW